MANKTATLKVNITYVGSSNETVVAPTLTKTVPYTAMSDGILDVPDTTASATVYNLPFGSIGAAATCCIIENRTGQDLVVKINGPTDSGLHSLASGGLFVFGADDSASRNPVTSASVTTTLTQSGAGEVGFRLFGDPT